MPVNVASVIARQFILIVLLMLVIAQTVVPAQAAPMINPGPEVIHIEQIDGHSTLDITRMLQSRSGFIWLAKYDGLMRFDGFNIKKFQHDEQNPHSLGHNFISAMVEDEDGYIWLATDGGLSRFNPRTEHFDNFTHNNDDITTLDSNLLFTLSLGKNNTLWIGSERGINRFDRKTLTNQRLNSALQPSDGQHFEDVQHILEDSHQRLWFSVEKKGLFVHHLDSKSPHHFEKNTRRNLSSTVITTIVQTRDSQTEESSIWVGTQYGLNRFDGINQRFEPINIPLQAQNNGVPIQTLFQDTANNLWIGTLHNGVRLYKPQQQAVITVDQNPDSPHTLSNLLINDVLQDTSGSLWFASPSKGLYKLPSKALLFEHYLPGLPALSDLPDLPSNAQPLSLTALYPDSNNHLWLGSKQHLYSFDLDSGQFEVAVSGIGEITAVGQSAEQHIMLHTAARGAFSFNPENRQLKPYSGQPATPFRHLNWQDTLFNKTNGALNQKAANSLGFNQTVSQAFKQLSQYTLTSVLPLKDRVLAATSLNGLRMLNRTTGQWSKITDDKHDIRRIWHIYQDNQQRIWLATEASGLAQLDLNTQTLKYVTTEQGLPTNSLRSIVADKQGILWLGTANGIASFNPKTTKVTAFGPSHGLRISAFAAGMSALTSNGDIVMSGTDSMVRFSPSRLFSAVAQANLDYPLLLSDLRLFDKAVKLTSQDPLSPLTHTINASKTLTLSHDQDWFSLSFASSNYDALDTIRYAYKMQGLSDHWIETDPGSRSATFTALAARDYVFQLRASNSHGSYNDRYRTINITITPPVWRTWQAYLLYFILLIGGTFSLYRYRTQALIKQAAQLEQIVRDRTARINSLMAQKEQMFANLSHEFKTPLTLIITPLASLLTSLEKVIPSELASEVSRKKSMMLRNGQRLLRMIDQLLELSDLQSDIDQSQVEYSLKETLELLLVAFEPLLNSKQQRLHCKPFDDVTVTLKTDALETILTNLISNAIKYTPNNGRINIAIHSTISVLNVSQVEISIIDTGIGISPQDQDIVFNRFTRADAKRNKNIPGAGIGLALVKELISSHQGSIELTSEVGEGSTFTVTLPISAKTAKQNQSAIESTTSISHTSKIEIESLLASTTDFVPIVDMPLSDQGKTTLLLIDDNAEMLELLVDTLQHKYYCLSALNGEEGLALARQQLPDLIISDVMMPGIDGFEVVKQLKQLELTCHIPVILLTAKGDLSSRLKGWSEKADEYLQKPFNETELLVRVDNLLSIRRLLHQRYQKAFLQSQDEQPHNQTNPAELIEPSEPLAPSEPIEPVKTTPLHQHFFNQLNAILAKHYSNEDFNVATLGSEMNLSNRQLSRKMKAILDLTPVESIRGFRLKRAAELLTNGATASTVAYEVGFTSHSYFSKCFKAQFDCSPSQFSQKEC